MSVSYVQKPNESKYLEHAYVIKSNSISFGYLIKTNIKIASSIPLILISWRI